MIRPANAGKSRSGLYGAKATHISEHLLKMNTKKGIDLKMMPARNPITGAACLM